MWQEKLGVLARDQRVTLPVVAVFSGALGLTAGYFLTATKSAKKFALIAESEIADVKRHYARIQVEEKPPLETLARQHQNIVEAQGYSPPDPSVVDIEAKEDDDEARNIFESFEPETYWDPEQEAVRRANDPLIPYVITKDEFDQAERDFEQVSLTYYEGDLVLADARDSVVDDQDGTVGAPNLIRFGQASNDRNVVYVRNERLSLDIEVLRSEGKYAEEVLGFIEHSDKQGIRKFRNHWD